MNSKLRFLEKLALASLLLTAGISPGLAQNAQTSSSNNPPALDRMLKKITQADREAAAARAAAAKKAATPAPLLAAAPLTGKAAAKPLLAAAMNPGGVPDYFGVANWANSPIIRKFVDTLPGVGAANANNLGNFIPIAIADTTTYPGSDYYQIGLVDYTQKMNSDLQPTKVRGYIDLAPGADGNAHYMGPLIIAKRDRPVRILFTNKLGVGAAGNLFLPVDTTVMGAGMGPMGMMANPMIYTQNRAVIHLHGGATPWISDGTPHQWTVPAGQFLVPGNWNYYKGISFQNVPDMLPVPDGSATYFYTNQQSNRLMFYHDHSYGMTRLNVYAGEAAGYLVTDPVEENLITQGLLPGANDGVYRYGIPLVIQDRTFVDPATIANTDPTWNWGTTPPTPHQGDLWMPHVYMPNQNPYDLSGANPFGRWDYGPWFWPPVTAAAGLVHGPIADPLNPARQIPGTPNPSMAMETFMDTPIVNGCAYPKLTVQHRPYRFRILNGCNERYLNLQLYYVDPLNPTEVKMVPAVATTGYPATWPTDGRPGGVPDPATAGPQMVQIGTEGGFLPAPVVLPNQPINYSYDRRNIVVLNVTDHTLLLGPAERADVIIDFSLVPTSAQVMLYNDAPAPIPAFDPRLDYYTGDPDQTATGGAPSTLIGFGPNTRTVMRFDVAGSPAPAAFNLAALQAAWPAAYVADQQAPVVPQTAYPGTYHAATDTYARIQDMSLTYTPVGGAVPVTTQFGNKAIQELFELDYGRMNATLGVELPLTNFNTQTTIPLGYIGLTTETLTNNGVQLWKVTHNGVDTHAVHFHLFNVQVINRVGWDGAVRPPDPNELGWKETVRMNPLEDCIVALQPVVPQLPFVIPNSVRPLDPTMPYAAPTDMITVTNPADGNPVTVANFDPTNTNVDPLNPPHTIGERYNFGWEYVWHCHMLGHEEMDFMRPMAMTGIVAADYLKALPAPYNLTFAIVGPPTAVTLNWLCNCPPGTSHSVERAPVNGSFTQIASLGDVLTYTDTTVTVPGTYLYRVLAFNATMLSPPSNTVTVALSIPAAPKTLVARASALSSNPPTVGLTWVNPAVNETGLHLQRSPSSTFPPATTITITLPAGSTSYTDSAVASRTSYSYRICTFNGIGSSAYSNTATVTTAGQLPLPPTALTVTGTTQTTVSLSWTPAANSTYTLVQRSTTGINGPWTTVVLLPQTTTTYKNINLTRNRTYWYSLKAYNAYGYSTATAGVPATTLP